MNLGLVQIWLKPIYRKDFFCPPAKAGGNSNWKKECGFSLLKKKEAMCLNLALA